MILAPRAVYLASLIGGERSVRLLRNVTKSSFPEVRVQAAAAANLPNEAAGKILIRVLDDSAAGVHNVALKSTTALSSSGELPKTLQEKIMAMSKTDQEQFIRGSSTKLLRHSHAK